MEKMEQKIIAQFGNQLRIRVCGICIENGRLLVVDHHALNQQGEFWGPPGGGMEFGEDASATLKREFREETKLEIEIGRFLCVHEYLAPPLHAIELFFLVKRTGGEIGIGYDPEMKKDEQIIKDVRFLDYTTLKKKGRDAVHGLFQHFDSLEALSRAPGYLFEKEKTSK
jgi:8-oxo-dGTP diphosphatase